MLNITANIEIHVLKLRVSRIPTEISLRTSNAYTTKGNFFPI